MFQRQPELNKQDKIILFIIALSFVFFQIFSSWISVFSLNHRFFSGFFFQIITFPFVNLDLFNLVLELIFIWFLGKTLLQKLGKKLFRNYFVIAMISASCFFLLTDILGLHHDQLMGFKIFSLGLLALTAYYFPNQEFNFMFLFPLKAKIICAIAFLLELNNAWRVGGMWPMISLVFGVAVAFFYLYQATKVKTPKKPHLSVVKDNSWH